MDGSRHSLLNKSAFIQALIDNLNSRLYDQVGFSSHQEFSSLLEEIDVLNPLKWPTGILSPWVHGESQLASLRGRLSVDFREIRGQFRDFIDNSQSQPAKIT